MGRRPRKSTADQAAHAGKIGTDEGLQPDRDLLGPCVQEALDELVDSASSGRGRAPRGRKTRKPPETS